jgi:hypothetical protein
MLQVFWARAEWISSQVKLTYTIWSRRRKSCITFWRAWHSTQFTYRSLKTTVTFCGPSETTYCLKQSPNILKHINTTVGVACYMTYKLNTYICTYIHALQYSIHIYVWISEIFVKNFSNLKHILNKWYPHQPTSKTCLCSVKPEQ